MRNLRKEGSVRGLLTTSALRKLCTEELVARLFEEIEESWRLEGEHRRLKERNPATSAETERVDDIEKEMFVGMLNVYQLGDEFSRHIHKLMKREADVALVDPKRLWEHVLAACERHDEAMHKILLEEVFPDDKIKGEEIWRTVHRLLEDLMGSVREEMERIPPYKESSSI